MAARVYGDTKEDQEELRVFFHAWCLHLLECAVRLRQYVSERAASVPSGSREPDIVADLLSKNVELAEQLHDVSTSVLDSAPGQIAHDWMNYYGRLKNDITIGFRRLHRRLWLIPAPWPRPELDLFVRRVLEAAGYEGSVGISGQNRWTLLLTEDYNFSDILPPELAYHDQNHLLGGQGQPSGTSSAIRGALTIPAAERQNPFAWLNLIHELGDFIAEVDGVVERAKSLPIVEAFQESSHLDYNRLYEYWIPEIVADLVATDLLGIGYYISFVQFATFWSSVSVRIPVRTHPPVEAREQYIRQQLGRWGGMTDHLRRELGKEYNVRKTLDNMDERERHRIYDERPRGFEWETEIAAVAQDIASLDEYKGLFRLPRKPIDMGSLTQLREQLAKGWLIASRSPEPLTWSLDEVEERLEEAKQKLPQVENDVRDIIAAATLAKVYRGRDPDRGLVHTFTKESDSGIRAALIRLWSQVQSADTIVTKSIEATEIMRFYRSSRA